jgi:hypothetical protein
MATNMGVLWILRRPSRRPADRPRHRRRIEFTVLEDRRLLTVYGITAVATPKILPNNGRFVSVTVSGVIDQEVHTDLGKATVQPPPAELAAIDAANASRPAPSVLELVTDQYGAVAPRIRKPVTKLLASATLFAPFSKTNPTARQVLLRQYSYSITVNLQAKANSVNRQYAINVSASDAEATVQKNIAVLVPMKRTPPQQRMVDTAQGVPRMKDRA